MLQGKPLFHLQSLNTVIAGLFIIVLFSCKVPVIVKNYQPNKPFVFQTNINLKGNFSNTNRSELISRLKGQLDDSMRSRSVSKIFWSVMKAPPVYDSSNADKSVVFMKALLNSSGYFRDTITYDTTLKVVNKDQHRTTVNFNVTAGKVVTLDSIGFNIKQQDLQNLTVASRSKSYLKKGEPFAKAVISAELDRLVDLYRNHGYLRFSRDELIGLWDTLNLAVLNPSLDPFEQIALLDSLRKSRDNPKANLEIRLRPGFDSSKLKKYFVGDITIYPDFPPDSSYTRKETKVNGIKVIWYRNIFKPKILPQNVYLHRGDVYEQQKYFKTVNRFNSLGSWRLVNLEQIPRKNGDTVDFNIRLTPAQKYSFSTNLEGSSNQSAVSGNLFGIGINVGLQNRNFAKAAIQSNSSIRFGVEIGDSSLLQTKQFSVSQNFNIPRAIPNSKWIPARIRENFRTFLSFNAANTERQDLYNLSTVNGSWGYEFQWNKKLMTIRIPNIEYSYLKKRQKLKDLIDSTPSLKNIFTDGFISSIITSLAVTGGHNKNVNVFRANVEESGLLTGFIKNSKFLDSNLYRFVKLDAEFTWKKQYRKSALAFRVFGGAGFELSSTVSPQKKNALPFFKQYFSGGPNSMRAWALRKLGPGSAIKEFNGVNAVPERYGDVQLEANLEYRFPIKVISGVKVNGALFTDMGNVWLLKNKAGPTEEVFNFNRIGKDIAVGAGVGLRIDFDFFVLRFDYSYKVKDPSPSPANAGLRNKWFGYKFRKGDQFQLGINYPFIL